MVPLLARLVHKRTLYANVAYFLVDVCDYWHVDAVPMDLFDGMFVCCGGPWSS